MSTEPEHQGQPTPPGADQQPAAPEPAAPKRAPWRIAEWLPPIKRSAGLFWKSIEQKGGLLKRWAWRIGALILLLVISILIWRAVVTGRAKPQASAESSARPIIAVARADPQNLYNEITIPAEFRPYVEVELHAKVSGYVQRMNVDFGDRVKAGQLLAVLEVPELQDQLHNAMAVKQRAEADYRAAHLNYTRLLAVSKDHPNLVAEQDLDTAQSKDGIAEAAIAAAKAEVERYQTLVAYTKITAPFDGVVTHRYVDQGALIQAGTTSETQSLPLVRVSDNYHLRLDFPVSVEYVKDIRVGAPVEVLVESLGDKTFSGVITRTTDRVNDDTRTMTTEIEVPNPNLEVVPGMYANVTLKVKQRPDALAIPTQAISGGKSGAKSTVFLVGTNGEVQERSVTLGLETPDHFEVTSGLRQGDLVMIAGRNRVQPGQKVTPVITASLDGINATETNSLPPAPQPFPADP